MRYFFVTIFLYASSLTGQAQDITGTWEEHSEIRFTSYTKLCIIKICDTYIGYTFDQDNEGGHCKANFSAVFNSKKKQLNGEGTSFMENTPGHLLATYILYYKSKKGEEYLDGLIYIKPDSARKLITNIIDTTGEVDQNPEYIRLKRISNLIDSTDFMRLMALKPCKIDQPVVRVPLLDVVVADEQKKPEVPVKDTAVVLTPEATILQMKTDRINDTISDVSTTDKELFIKVMDNAIFDGDTISIIHNGKVIAERILVSGKPFPIKIILSKEVPFHVLTLVAHNLGSIPPNTALLLINNGNKEYRLYAFADLKKNAVIIFRYTGE
jgi:hypothetical protein